MTEKYYILSLRNNSRLDKYVLGWSEKTFLFQIKTSNALDDAK